MKSSKVNHLFNITTNPAKPFQTLHAAFHLKFFHFQREPKKHQDKTKRSEMTCLRVNNLFNITNHPVKPFQTLHGRVSINQLKISHDQQEAKNPQDKTKRSEMTCLRVNNLFNITNHPVKPFQTLHGRVSINQLKISHDQQEAKNPQDKTKKSEMTCLRVNNLFNITNHPVKPFQTLHGVFHLKFSHDRREPKKCRDKTKRSEMKCLKVNHLFNITTNPAKPFQTLHAAFHLKFFHFQREPKKHQDKTKRSEMTCLRVNNLFNITNHPVKPFQTLHGRVSINQLKISHDQQEAKNPQDKTKRSEMTCLRVNNLFNITNHPVKPFQTLHGRVSINQLKISHDQQEAKNPQDKTKNLKWHVWG